jgi:N-acetylmuramoyl-L-alanine amidase
MASELNIFQQPSPNFGIRRGGVMPSIIVLHYTAMKSSKDAIERLSDPKSEVSAHYLIDEAGKVIQLVDEQKELGMLDKVVGEKLMILIPIQSVSS